MKLRLAFILVSLLGCVVGSPTFNNMVVHDSRTAPPPGFVSQGAAPAGEMLTLRLAMTPNNIAGLEESLYAVSTPSSALYGQHLTKEEVRNSIQPLVVDDQGLIDRLSIIGRIFRCSHP